MPRRSLLARVAAAAVATGLALSGCAGFTDLFAPPVPYPTREPLPTPTLPEFATPNPIATSPFDTDPEPPYGAFEMTVVSIHDGDTLKLRIARTNDIVTTTKPITVRLIGVDTPEIYPVYECWGDEATSALERLAPVGSTVTVAVDFDTWDDYDRRLFYLWNDEGVFINLDLVREGDATAIRVMPNDAYWPELRAAQDDAYTNELGLWGECARPDGA